MTDPKTVVEQMQRHDKAPDLVKLVVANDGNLEACENAARELKQDVIGKSGEYGLDLHETQLMCYMVVNQLARDGGADE